MLLLNREFMSGLALSSHHEALPKSEYMHAD